MEGYVPMHCAWVNEPFPDRYTLRMERGETISGRELTLSYKGGTKVVTVPEGAPVVTFTDATRSDVVAGKKVFIIAKVDGPGKYTAMRVFVEKDGVAPPM